MLFNSYEFIFGFLPICLVLFFLFGRVSRGLALGWLVIASLLFYAWWRPVNVFIIVSSILTNLIFARSLLRLNTQAKPNVSMFVLALGILANIGFLGYFKYANFVKTVLIDVSGSDFTLTAIVLPLAISFFTFQQIAFLIDVHGGRIDSFKVREYPLFVLFFPQLIAGPIVHYREMMPQFQTTSCRFNSDNLSVGLTLFCIGLFKKVVLADGIAPYVSPIYEIAAGGGTVSLFPAWLAAAGFTLQIYFDFSGYSDMAAGLGRIFGVRLPINFDSPLKASNIIDFWSRWHITLTRFLTAYVYNPLALWLTRRRLARGLPGFRGRNSSLGAFLHILAAPTVFTMFLSGLWHGAGYLFIAWGTLHGIYLTINHAWRLVGPGLWRSRESYERFMRPAGFILTFLCVVFGMVLFRATSPDAAAEILSGMVGINGIGLPQSLLERLGGVVSAIGLDAFASSESLTDFVLANAWLVALLVIALALPNSIEMLAGSKPVLGTEQMNRPLPWLARTLPWRPTPAWAIVIGALGIAAVMRLSEDSEFLYWQF